MNLSKLDLSEIHSALGLRRVRFDQITTKQMFDKVLERARQLADGGSIRDEVLSWMAYIENNPDPKLRDGDRAPELLGWLLHGAKLPINEEARLEFLLHPVSAKRQATCQHVWREETNCCRECYVRKEKAEALTRRNAELAGLCLPCDLNHGDARDCSCVPYVDAPDSGRDCALTNTWLCPECQQPAQLGQACASEACAPRLQDAG